MKIFARTLARWRCPIPGYLPEWLKVSGPENLSGLQSALRKAMG